MIARDYTSESARRQMIEDQLRRRGIGDDRVLRVMSEIPRERFVPKELARMAYDDRALEIGLGQTISQPYIVAYMTEQLQLQPTHRILEIGTGSGYQTAVLASLCETVYSVECLPELSEKTQVRLHQLGLTNIRYAIRDGTLGWPEHAPYERIIVTAGAPDIPGPLLDQVQVGGKMILPIGNHKAQQLVLIEKKDNRFVEFPLIGCRFVKLIGQRGWKAP
ncbi:MAG: protein-L-isoaspartate(D-aspartate) O-methyltransferase [Planctomycetes bacterium]|nr:protein-L-isoaspartate(D-aspartate) O-methyltransferase [Planctomycetota bacterium]MCH8964945.1 protein-L-isoaspartate(D-aspartate) O-methyltransferase [Planctomycetota bacterium]